MNARFGAVEPASVAVSDSVLGCLADLKMFIGAGRLRGLAGAAGAEEDGILVENDVAIDGLTSVDGPASDGLSATLVAEGWPMDKLRDIFSPSFFCNPGSTVVSGWFARARSICSWSINRSRSSPSICARSRFCSAA